MTQRRRFHAKPARRAALPFDDPARVAQHRDDVLALYAIQVGGRFGRRHAGRDAIRALIAAIRGG